jgi:hypothetical protein
MIDRVQKFVEDQAERSRQSDERWQRLLAAVAEAGENHREWASANDLPWYRQPAPRPWRYPRTES